MCRQAEIRIAVIIAETRVTGLVRQLIETLDRLDGNGCAIQVAVVVRANADPEPISSELRTRGIAYELVRESGAFDPSLVGKMDRLLRDWSPHLVQTHGYKPNVLGLFAKNRLGLPWVAFYHGRTTTDLKVRLYHQLNCHVMSRASTIVAVAHGVQSHLRKRDQTRVRVIQNAVVPDQRSTCSREESRRRLGLSSNELAVGFIGRLSNEKGPDLFLEAFALLSRTMPNTRAIIVGEGPLLASLSLRAARLGVSESVRFCGYLEEVHDVYKALDLVAIASRSEVFPNVLLEAVSAGVPVVATRVGGIPFIAEGLDSIVPVEPLDERALASAMEAALKFRSESAIDSARIQVRERYSQERRATELLNLYRELAHVT